MIWLICDSLPVYADSRQRSREGKVVVFKTTLIAWSRFNPHPGHVVASLDKTIYDDYLCLIASNISGQEFEEIYRSIGSLKTSKQLRISSSTK